MGSRQRLVLDYPAYSPVKSFLSRAPPSLICKLFFYMQWPDLTSLSATSRSIRETVVTYRTKAWNIASFLHHFVDHSGSFRETMAFSGALLTGPQVLRFFDRLRPTPELSLDIVTRVGGVIPLVLFLESIGYTRRPDAPSLAKGSYPVMSHIFQITSSSQFAEKGGATGLVTILEYWRPSKGLTDRYTKIDIAVVTQTPIEHIILSYHSSAIMNFISYKEAVSVFPSATFLRREVYPSSREDLGPFWNPRWAMDLRDMGFCVNTTRSDPPVFIGDRRAADKMSWVIPFKDWEDDPKIKREVKRSIYGDDESKDYEFDVVWMSEATYGIRQWRLAIFEPKIFWYLVPTFLLRGN